MSCALYKVVPWPHSSGSGLSAVSTRQTRGLLNRAAVVTGMGVLCMLLCTLGTWLTTLQMHAALGQ